MQSNTSPDTFSTFLKTLNEKQTLEPSSSSGPLMVLQMLARRNGSQPLLELAKDTNLDLSVLRQSLDMLVTSKLVEISGDQLNQTVAMTTAGKSMLELR